MSEQLFTGFRGRKKMNSTFKVVFNKARGALMVVNEATSSVQAKGTKTVIAAAVTALMAGGAMAALPEDGVITNENLNDVGTTKLTSGKGQTVTIQTNGSVSQLIADLNAVNEATDFSAKLAALRHALGYNEAKDHAVMVGVTGGWNLMDQNTAQVSSVVLSQFDHTLGEKWAGQFGYELKIDDEQNPGESSLCRDFFILPVLSLVMLKGILLPSYLVLLAAVIMLAWANKIQISSRMQVLPFQSTVAMSPVLSADRCF